MIATEYAATRATTGHTAHTAIRLGRIEFEEIEDYAADTSEFVRLIEARGTLVVDYAALETE